jgi:hypothetical protein
MSAVLPALTSALALACNGSEPPAGARSQETWTQAELEATSLRIQAEVERLRGERFREPVAVKLASREDFVRYAKERQARLQSPTELAADETVAKMLGLFPVEKDYNQTMLDLIEGQVGGFYDPSTKTFFLMESMPVALGGIILAHELGHALDDQLHDLDGVFRMKLHTDAELAYASVVEGSGTAVMQVWTQEHVNEIDLSAATQMNDDQMRSMADAPMVLWRPLMAAYLQGSAFLHNNTSLLETAKAALPNQRIREAFQDRPSSTEQVLHPERYWNKATRDEPTLVSLDEGALPQGWSALQQDTLGELMTAIVSTPPSRRGGLDASNPLAILGVKFTNDVAMGWDGDRLLLAAKGHGRHLTWVTRWDSPRDAGEFFGCLAGQFADLEDTAKALTEQAAIPGGATSPEGTRARPRSGVELTYGDQDDVVVLRVWVAVDRGDLRDLEKLPYTVERR